jgi:DNA polymerase III sliding clamp (beta) subunit (PCNA family)
MIAMKKIMKQKMKMEDFKMEMKLNCDKIKEVFGVAEKFLSDSAMDTFYNYANIEIEKGGKARIHTGDGTYSFAAPFDVEESNGEGNKFLLPMKSFMKLLKDITQPEFNIIVDKSSIKIKGKKFKYNLTVNVSNEYGELKTGIEQNSFKINAKILAQSLQKVLYCAADPKGDKQLQYASVHINMNSENTDIVTTDTHRLSRATITSKNFIESDKDTIKTINNILPIIKNYEGEIEVKIFDNMLQLIFNNGYIITTRKIVEKFPDYSTIANLYLNNNEVVIDKTGLTKALKRISGINEKGIMSMKFDKKEVTLSMAQSEKGDGEEILEVINDNNYDKTICINLNYLIDAISNINSAEVVLRISDDPFKAMGIKEFHGDDNYINILMPTRF